METLISFLFLIPFSGGAFTGIPNDAAACYGTNFLFKWSFESASLFVAEWKFNGLLMLDYDPTASVGNQYTHYNGYNSTRLIPQVNGDIMLTNVITADNGNYSCVISYTSGSPNIFTDIMTFTVQSLVSTNLTCTYNNKTDEINCNVPAEIGSLTINEKPFVCPSFPCNGSHASYYTICMVYDCFESGVQRCTSFPGQSQDFCQVSDIKKRNLEKGKTDMSTDDTGCKTVCPVTVVITEIFIWIASCIVYLQYNRIWSYCQWFIYFATHIALIISAGIISGLIVKYLRENGCYGYCCEEDVVRQSAAIPVAVVLVFVMLMMAYCIYNRCKKLQKIETTDLEITNESPRKSINGDAGANNLFSCNSRQETAASAPIDPDRPDPLDPNRP